MGTSAEPPSIIKSVTRFGWTLTLVAVCFSLPVQDARSEETAVRGVKASERAENTLTPAEQFDLGVSYDKGRGVPKDEEKAVYWYTKSAEQGYLDAQYNLAELYYSGTGVKQNYKEAARWYEKAAEQGDPSSQFNLAVLYYDGLGVDQDYSQAIYWYEKAAVNGDHHAQYNLAQLYDGENNKSGEIDHLKSAYWYKQAAEGGVAQAQHNLGNYFVNGKGVNQDYKQAVYWFKKAAEQGYAGAQTNLGAMHASGWGVPQDIDQAKYWFGKAAAQGDAVAKRNLKAIQGSESHGTATESQICKAGIATVMGKAPSIISITGSRNNIVFLYYIRGSDGSRWEFKCKVSSDEIIWATANGPWRTRSGDSDVEFSVTGDRLTITEKFSDGSARSRNFNVSQL